MNHSHDPKLNKINLVVNLNLFLKLKPEYFIECRDRSCLWCFMLKIIVKYKIIEI